MNNIAVINVILDLINEKSYQMFNINHICIFIL